MMHTIHEAHVTKNGRDIMISEEQPGVLDWTPPRFVVYIPHNGPEIIVPKDQPNDKLVCAIDDAVTALSKVNLPDIRGW